MLVKKYFVDQINIAVLFLVARDLYQI